MSLRVGRLTPLIQVFDMPTSIAFYRDRIGFTVAAQSSPGEQFDWALLTLGDAALMLNTAHEAHDRPPAPDSTRRAAHGDTTLFIDCPDVDAAHALFAARGVVVDPPVVRVYGMKQLNVVDPDGYALCFQCPAQ